MSGIITVDLAADPQFVAHIKNPDAVMDIAECRLCGKPDRRDFMMRRVNEIGRACRHCTQPGLPMGGRGGMCEPKRSLHRIPALINAGYFRTYERYG